MEQVKTVEGELELAQEAQLQERIEATVTAAKATTDAEDPCTAKHAPLLNLGLLYVDLDKLSHARQKDILKKLDKIAHNTNGGTKLAGDVMIPVVKTKNGTVLQLPAKWLAIILGGFACVAIMWFLLTIRSELRSWRPASVAVAAEETSK